MSKETAAVNDITISMIVIAALLGLLVNGVWLALAATAVTLLVVVGYARGWWSWIRPFLARLLAWARALLARSEVVETAVYAPYDVLLGVDPITGTPDVENLADLGNIGVYGTTRFGKTTWLHSIIHHLIAHHSANELRLAISDPKTVDYPFYGSLPHLLCPIARDKAETAVMVRRLLDEMGHRAGLYSKYAGRRICNNLDRYAELSGERLPRIIAIFDELADVVEPDSDLEKDLIRLSKLGLAYGIHLILATQRPSSKVVTGEIKSQMASKFVTWMPTNREYGVVAELPREMYQEMPRTRGRFMAYTAQGWRFIQGTKITDAALEAAARRLSGRPRRWAETAVPAPSWDDMSEAEKITAVRQFAADLGKRPTISEIVERFEISKPTAIKYRNFAEGKGQG